MNDECAICAIDAFIMDLPDFNLEEDEIDNDDDE